MESCFAFKREKVTLGKKSESKHKKRLWDAKMEQGE